MHSYRFRMTWDVLKRICLMDEEEFIPYGVNLLDANYPLIYKDNDANVLAVAHLDSCHERQLL